MLISDLKRGGAINWKNGVWTAADITFVNPGKGSAFVRAKLKSLKSERDLKSICRCNSRENQTRKGEARTL